MPVLTAPSPSLTLVPPPEARRSVRRPNVCEAWVRSPTETDDAKTEALSLDVSRHGVGFESTRPLAEGCFYWVEIGIGDQRIAQEVRVVTCTESDGTPGAYRVGAEFC